MICQSTRANYCHGYLAQVLWDKPGIGEWEHALPVWHLLAFFFPVSPHTGRSAILLVHSSAYIYTLLFSLTSLFSKVMLCLLRFGLCFMSKITLRVQDGTHPSSFITTNQFLHVFSCRSQKPGQVTMCSLHENNGIMHFFLSCLFHVSVRNTVVSL